MKPATLARQKAALVPQRSPIRAFFRKWQIVILSPGCIYYINPEIKLEIAVSVGEREQSHFEGSREGARENTEGAL